MLRMLRRVSCVLALSLPVSVHALEVGEVGPDWELYTVTGDSVRYYADAGNSTSVILFWATWCPYCRTLMPHLQTLADEFRESPVRFYALDVWDEGDPVAYMERHGYTFTLLPLANAVAFRYGVQGTPGLFVLDGDHRVIYRRGGGETDADVEKRVRAAIAGTVDTPGARQPAMEPAAEEEQ